MFWLHIVREEETAIFAYIFPTWLGASANFGVFRRLLASTILRIDNNHQHVAQETLPNHIELLTEYHVAANELIISLLAGSEESTQEKWKTCTE